MNTEFMKGVVVPILTVIDDQERIDEAGMRDQVEYVIRGGVSGILAFGSNGEFYMVEEDEMARGLAMDPASFPVAAKDMAALRGRQVGNPYLPTLPTPEGPVKEGFRRTMRQAGLL